MTKFNEHTGIVVPLDITNVDTDNIIPKQFLQKITRENFGAHLFNNWRFSDTKNKKINQKFILNYPCYKNASILLTRENFGCGSSREHAVWALIDYGFRVIISSSFADIFYNNSFNNQLLLITLSKSQIEELFTQIKTTKDSCNIFTVNLIKQKLYTQKKSYYFQIKKFYRDCILYGLDHVDSTLMHEKDIQKYEDKLKHY